jgi:hypothetical protein
VVYQDMFFRVPAKGPGLPDQGQPGPVIPPDRTLVAGQSGQLASRSPGMG